MSRSILVTGGAGNIGASLVRKLAEDESNQIVIVDDLSTGSMVKLPKINKGNWRFIKCDCNDLSQLTPVMCSNKFEIVFHYAATVGVKRTLENPARVLRDVKGIENIITLAHTTGVKKVFYSSSSEVYGESTTFPQLVSQTPLNSRLPYAIVKNLGEAAFRAASADLNLDFTIFRFFNTYGPLQSDDFVLPKFIRAALSDLDIEVYGDGSQSRTFCYIDDNIETVEKILYLDICGGETLNIGSDIEVNIGDLANLIIKLTKSKSKIKFLPPLEDGDMQRRLPNVDPMRKILGKELVPLEEGILRLVHSFRG